MECEAFSTLVWTRSKIALVSAWFGLIRAAVCRMQELTILSRVLIALREMQAGLQFSAVAL